jgi:hypothetical protein
MEFQFIIEKSEEYSSAKEWKLIPLILLEPEFKEKRLPKLTFRS